MPQTPLNAPSSLAYAHIANAGTVVVKNTSGLLDSVTINSGSAGSAMELFDNNVTITGTVAIGNFTPGAVTVPAVVNYGGGNAGLKFNTGLVVVTTGTLDATILFR